MKEPNSGENPRFQVSINGRVICTAGIDRIGVLAADVTWVYRDPKKKPPDYTMEMWIRNAVEVRVGGLDSSTNTHVHWGQKSLSAGDEVVIKVLPPGQVDESKSMPAPEQF